MNTYLILYEATEFLLLFYTVNMNRQQSTKLKKNSLVKFYSYLNSIFYISELEILFLCIE